MDWPSEDKFMRVYETDDIPQGDVMLLSVRPHNADGPIDCKHLATLLQGLPQLSCLMIEDSNGCSNVESLSQLWIPRNPLGLWISADTFAGIPPVSTYVKLQLREANDLTDSDITSLNSVRCLQLQCPKITSVPDTSKWSSLRCLDLYQCNSLSSISLTLPEGLKILSIDQCSGLTSIGPLRTGAIEETDSINSSVPPYDEQCDLVMTINRCTRLEQLHNFELKLGRLTLAHCNNLVIDGCQFEAITSLHIKECSKFTTLDCLQQISSLRALRINSCPDLTVFGPLELAGLTYLKASAMHHFSSLKSLVLPDLQHISFRECGLTSVDFRNIQSRNLQVVKAIGCEVQSLHAVSTLTNLEELNLSANTPLVSLESKEHLQDYILLKQLRILILDHCSSLAALPQSLRELLSTYSRFREDSRLLRADTIERQQLLVSHPSLLAVVHRLRMGSDYSRSDDGRPTVGRQQLLVSHPSVWSVPSLSMGSDDSRSDDSRRDVERHRQTNCNWLWSRGLYVVEPIVLGNSTGKLSVLGLKGCSSLAAGVDDDWSTARKLHTVLNAQSRNCAVMRLTKQQQPIIETLERMSWLVVLLATATFVAFLNPPGGWSAAGNGVAALAGSDEYHKRVMLAFFILDSLSFALSLGCVMMIVVLSMPRVLYENDKLEAGLMWIQLIFTWSLLYFAVVSGLGAFVASGLSVYDYQTGVIWSVLPGMLVLLMGSYTIIKRFMGIWPGKEAFWLGAQRIFFCWQPESAYREVIEDEAVDRQFLLSGSFWRCAHMAMFGNGTEQNYELVNRPSRELDNALVDMV